MKKPIIDYYIRRAMRDKPDNKYTKRYLTDIERWRIMREADREIEKLVMPIIKWMDKNLKRLQW